MIIRIITIRITTIIAIVIITIIVITILVIVMILTLYTYAPNASPKVGVNGVTSIGQAPCFDMSTFRRGLKASI